MRYLVKINAWNGIKFIDFHANNYGILESPKILTFILLFLICLSLSIFNVLTARKKDEALLVVLGLMLIVQMLIDLFTALTLHPLTILDLFVNQLRI